MKNKIISIVPGLLISIIVMMLSKVFALFLPLLGAATIAIFLGILLGNTILKDKKYEKGTKFSESKLLELSIVFLGSTITFDTLKELGLNGLLFIVIQMTITIIACVAIGKKLKFSKTTSLLMASGNAVCGSSAIAATAPVINASDEEKGNTITLINVMGTVLMLVLPLLSFILYKHELVKTSALIGGTLQSVGQVVASGLLVNEDVSNMAAIFKIVRIIFLTVVVIGMGLYTKDNTQSKNKVSIKKLVPWYIIGFFILCLLASMGLVPEMISILLKKISGYFEIIALAAIGLRLNIAQIKENGVKLLLYGLIIIIIQVTVAVTLIYFLI